MVVAERAYWLAWSQISGVGPILLQRLHHHFDNLSAAWVAAPRELQQIEGVGKQTLDKLLADRDQIDPEELLEKHLEQNPNFWTPVDSDYPALLLEIPNPPPLLYYRGIVEPEENRGIKPSIAIVGTRYPSEYGRRWTRKIASILTEQGFTIVSGLAAGIDAEAHRACLDVGGRTVAVFGTGVDLVYPKENRNLGERILSQGLVISEYAAGTKPNAKHFPQRNRIVAGLSRAVLVMEAPQKSGALITANIANEFGRDVYVLPARLDDENSHGCLALIDKGGQVIPVDLDQLLQMLGAMPSLDRVSSEPESVRETEPVKREVPALNLAPELAQVFAEVPGEPMLFDGIVQRTGLGTGTVSSALLQLELMGLVKQVPGMRYQRV